MMSVGEVGRMVGRMRLGIVAVLLGLLAGCASHNGSVFKANEMNADVFSSSVTGR